MMIAGSLHSIAEALLLLLDSTSEPIVPFNLQSVCLGASSNYLQCKQVSSWHQYCLINFSFDVTILFYVLQIVVQLPEYRKNVFLYLCFFLQELLSHANENGLDAKTLGMLFILFSDILLIVFWIQVDFVDFFQQPQCLVEFFCGTHRVPVQEEILLWIEKKRILFIIFLSMTLVTMW